MSDMDMEVTGAALSSVTSINKEQQDDVQSTPNRSAEDSIALFEDPREVLNSAPGLNRGEPPTTPDDITRPNEGVFTVLPGQNHIVQPTTPDDITRPNEGVFTVLPGQNHIVQPTTPRNNALPDEQEPEGGVPDLVAILLRKNRPEILIDVVIRQVAFLSNVGGCSHQELTTPENEPKVEDMIEKVSGGYKLDEIIFAEKDPVFLRQLLEHILDSEIIASSHDAENASTSSRDAVLEALLEPAPCHSRANANLPAPLTEEDP